MTATSHQSSSPELISVQSHAIKEDQERKGRTYENRGHYRENPVGSDVFGLWA
jgi:hypothetical protein